MGTNDQNQNNIVTIENKRFAFGKMPPRTAFPLQIKLARVLGEGILRMVVGLSGAKTLTVEELLKAARADPEGFSEGVGKLLMNAHHDTVMALMEEIFAWVSVADSGKRGIGGDAFDPTFDDMSPLAPWKVLREALRFNYASVFPASPSRSSPPGQSIQ